MRFDQKRDGTHTQVDGARTKSSLFLSLYLLGLQDHVGYVKTLTESPPGSAARGLRERQHVVY